jgi:2,3-bisphosphoglycerate-independent phosphoglycerate mutase
MKYVILIGDGMADRPLSELGGRTPLQAAFTPNMDKLARRGRKGIVSTIPSGMSPGSDVANMSILGYDPVKHYSGRGPLEAASIGVELDDKDVAYRCNLVTLKFNKEKTRAFMEDYSSGHISSEESRTLVEEIGAQFDRNKVVFYPGMSYRHLMVWRDGETKTECTPPHDIIGKEITDYLPLGPGSAFLQQLMRDSVDILGVHEVNRLREEQGMNPANSIWLWGQGRKPELRLFKEKYGVSGAMVSAVDLTKGLGIYAGMEILDVPGVTGYLDTNYLGKAEYSLRALERLDLVYIHVEAPDEAGHSGNYRDKIKAIEDFDSLVVGSVLRGMKAFDEYRILLMPDHATPIVLRTHSDEPVPFVIFDSTSDRTDDGTSYSEEIAEMEGVVKITRGHELMKRFIQAEGI